MLWCERGELRQLFVDEAECRCEAIGVDVGGQEAADVACAEGRVSLIVCVNLWYACGKATADRVRNGEDSIPKPPMINTAGFSCAAAESPIAADARRSPDGLRRTRAAARK